MMITDLLHIIFPFIIYIKLFLNICFPYWLSTCFVMEDEPELYMLLRPLPRSLKYEHSLGPDLFIFVLHVCVYSGRRRVVHVFMYAETEGQH